MKVFIYTDGACSGNPGMCGYCAILKYGEAVNSLKCKCDVTVISDSKYVCDAINRGWLVSWKQNGWRKSNNKAVLNVDLWMRLDSLLTKHNVAFRWIQGHSGHPENERCDKIAVKEYQMRQMK